MLCNRFDILIPPVLVLPTSLATERLHHQRLPRCRVIAVAHLAAGLGRRGKIGREAGVGVAADGAAGVTRGTSPGAAGIGATPADGATGVARGASPGATWGVIGRGIEA